MKKICSVLPPPLHLQREWTRMNMNLSGCLSSSGTEVRIAKRLSWGTCALSIIFAAKIGSDWCCWPLSILRTQFLSRICFHVRSSCYTVFDNDLHLPLLCMSLPLLIVFADCCNYCRPNSGWNRALHAVEHIWLIPPRNCHICRRLFEEAHAPCQAVELRRQSGRPLDRPLSHSCLHWNESSTCSFAVTLRYMSLCSACLSAAVMEYVCLCY